MKVETIVLSSMNLENLRRLAASSSKVLYAAAIMHIAGFILLAKAKNFHQAQERDYTPGNSVTILVKVRPPAKSTVMVEHIRTQMSDEVIMKQPRPTKLLVCRILKSD